jgi:hypothetical protein
MGVKGEYYWVRVFDYIFDRDSNEKGIMLDEFYLKDVPGGREEVKERVKEQYCSKTASDLKFSKPKKQTNGIYAIIMDSEKYWYDRFYTKVDTHCFWCLKPVKGKAGEFPREYIGDDFHYTQGDDIFGDLTKTAFFCCYDCKRHYSSSIRHNEGEFQMKEEGQNGDIFGYIYLIYNRAEDVNYIGQTRYMPFFRWQEHIKSGKKGNITDLSFSVLTEVFRNPTMNEDQNQLYLNSMEAWWIAKYEHERQSVVNVTKPKITIQYLRDRFNDMVLKQEQFQLEL